MVEFSRHHSPQMSACLIDTGLWCCHGVTFYKVDQCWSVFPW